MPKSKPKMLTLREAVAVYRAARPSAKPGSVASMLAQLATHGEIRAVRSETLYSRASLEKYLARPLNVGGRPKGK